MEETLKVKFVVREVITERKSARGNIVQHHQILIALKHLGKNVDKVHATFTKFIMDYWRNASPNTQYSRAQDVISFLNWMLRNKNRFEKFNSFEDLTFEIGTDYLNNYGLDNGRETVQKSESSLMYFYYYLAKNKMLKYITVNDFEHVVVDKKKKTKLPSILSPFEDVKYPNAKRTEAIHSLPKPVLPLLFEVSERYTPDITLALALSMFGGLRVGGILNLNKSALQPLGNNAQNGFIADVRKRTLRKETVRIKSTGKPKKERKQIIDIDLANMVIGENKLQLYYSKHVLRYSSKEESGALFVDNNRKAMTIETYKERFSKLKKEFIKCLENHEDYNVSAYAQTLKTAKWHTHILRGIYTNLEAEKTDNPIILQNKRGDSTAGAALSYITDSDKQRDELKEISQEMYRDMFEDKIKAVNGFKAAKRG